MTSYQEARENAAVAHNKVVGQFFSGSSFHQAYKNGFDAGFEYAIALLRTKSAMGFEIDAGLRCGDAGIFSDWLQRQRDKDEGVRG